MCVQIIVSLLYDHCMLLRKSHGHGPIILFFTLLSKNCEIFNLWFWENNYFVIWPKQHNYFVILRNKLLSRDHGGKTETSPPLSDRLPLPRLHRWRYNDPAEDVDLISNLMKGSSSWPPYDARKVHHMDPVMGPIICGTWTHTTSWPPLASVWTNSKMDFQGTWFGWKRTSPTATPVSLRPILFKLSPNLKAAQGSWDQTMAQRRSMPTEFCSGKMPLERPMALFVVLYKEEARQTRGWGVYEAECGLMSSQSFKLPAILVAILSTRVSFSSVS